ncbi:MAG TPA: hypothetical protein VFQ85_08260 [Mycobacteriales bacterium]|nr:hypothetical protein [Mycobacteriales bacterium]
MVDPRQADGVQSAPLDPLLSRDGSVVVWTAPLRANDWHSYQVFLFDRRTRRRELVSVGLGGRYGNDMSVARSVSDDGRFVLYQSAASNLAPGRGNGLDDLFLRDRLRHYTTFITRGHAPALHYANGAAAMSGDGSLVVYEDCIESDCGLVGYRVATRELFTVAMHVNCGGVIPVLSDDGRYVVYSSCEQETDEDRRTNSACSPDLFVRDVVTGATTLLTGDLDPLNNQCVGDPRSSNGGSLYRNWYYEPQFGSRGRCVLFLAGDGKVSRVWLRDLTTGAVTLVHTEVGESGWTTDPHADVTGDCQHVFFTAHYRTDAGTAGPSGETTLYRWDRGSGAVTRVTPDLPQRADTDVVNGFWNANITPAIGHVQTSNDGRVLAIRTSLGYDPEDSNGRSDIYLHAD